MKKKIMKFSGMPYSISWNEKTYGGYKRYVTIDGGDVKTPAEGVYDFKKKYWIKQPGNVHFNDEIERTLGWNRKRWPVQPKEASIKQG